jgi:hypothetical protein
MIGLCFQVSLCGGDPRLAACASPRAAGMPEWIDCRFRQSL